MLSAHAPSYNRRSRFPHRWWWVALTDEAFPRFSVVRAPRQARAVGPFRSRSDAADTAALFARFTGVRTCATRLGRSAVHGPSCPEREVSPCPAARDVSVADYADAPLETPVMKLLPGAKTLLFGLANDEVGYIIPKRQWDERSPFCYGRKTMQYGEINSCGPEVAPILMQALKLAVEQAR